MEDGDDGKGQEFSNKRASSLELEGGRRTKRGYVPNDDSDEEPQDLTKEDESFFDLLSAFASLDFPSAGDESEKCPICTESFSLSKLADHVYICIKQLDQEEKVYQESRDAQLASQLAGGEPQMIEFAVAQSCQAGINCRRTDFQHFINLKHPEVPCPLCENLCPVYEIDTHVTFCLQTGGKPKPKRKTSTPLLSSTPSPTTAAPAMDLSNKQISVMARSVLAARESKGQGVTGEEDASLLDMLGAFRQLGLTQDVLKRQLSNSKLGTTPTATPTPPTASVPFGSSIPSFTSIPPATSSSSSLSSSTMVLPDMSAAQAAFIDDDDL